MNIRSFAYGLIFFGFGTQIGLSADIDAQLIKKVQQLEKELLELKKQHQERVAEKSTVQEPQEFAELLAVTEKKDEDLAPKPLTEKKLYQPIKVVKMQDDKASSEQEASENDARSAEQKDKNLARKPPADKKLVQPNKSTKKQEVTEKDEQSSPESSQAEELYTQAQIFLNQKHPEQAKTILANLCESYPESPHYIMAKYWLGEIGLVARDHTNASIAYGEAYSVYKERLANKEQISPEVRNRAIESLAKLAFCLKQLSKRQDACVTLEQFNKEASEVPYNIQRFALQVSDQLKCQKKPLP